MASGPAGPLRFRTPHIEELPTAQSKQAPGFAWVQVAGPPQDPSKNWGTDNRKRNKNVAPLQTESQREALTVRQQKEIERKIKELNSDNSKDVQIPIPKKDAGGGGGGARAGKTTNTKKILASGKTFGHYLDDEEAEIARTGRRDGDLDVAAPAQQRASKTPIARRKPRDESSLSGSPAPSLSVQPSAVPAGAMDIDQEDEDVDGLPLPPSEAEMEALLNAPPLTFNQARSAAPPANAPPPRKFCEVCGYFGRAKCMKCGAMTCSVMCKDTHDEQRCLKFYA